MEPIKISSSEYACPFCSTIMKKHAYMIDHIRTHTGEKPFICTFCNQRFSRKSSLKVHLKKCATMF